MWSPPKKIGKGEHEQNERSPVPLSFIYLFPRQSWKHSFFRAITAIVFIVQNLRNKVQKRCNRRAGKNPKDASKSRFSLQSIPFSSAFVRWIQALTRKTQILNRCTSVSLVEKQSLCPASGINLQVWVPCLQGGTQAAARGTHEHTQTKPGQDDSRGAAAPGIWGAMTLTLP